MLGSTPTGETGARESPIASVRQLEDDAGILLRKLETPRSVKPGTVEYPWYPADVRAGAIPDLAALFTSKIDNWLFPFQRYVSAHRMSFALRPGERVEFFHRGAKGDFFLPFKFDGADWSEFPKPVPAYRIRTEDGPKSQKDAREWGTGVFEYTPDLSDRAAYYPRFERGFNESVALGDKQGAGVLCGDSTAIFEVSSPWVIYRAQFELIGDLPGEGDRWSLETSTDEGRTWQQAEVRKWTAFRRLEGRTCYRGTLPHGSWSAVSGSYRYLVRIRLANAATVRRVKLRTNFQVNPRSLPGLQSGENTMVFEPAAPVRRIEHRFDPSRLGEFAFASRNLKYLGENGNGLMIPETGKPADVILELAAPDGSPLQSFDAGARFLRIENGLAPDKYTAEVRRTAWQSTAGKPSKGSIEWGLSPSGPFQPIWEFNGDLMWRDGQPVDRTLLWPEVDKTVSLPAGTRKVYVRYSVQNMALDSLRSAVEWRVTPTPTNIEIVHRWTENDQAHTKAIIIPAGTAKRSYVVNAGTGVVNQSVSYVGKRP